MPRDYKCKPRGRGYKTYICTISKRRGGFHIRPYSVLRCGFARGRQSSCAGFQKRRHADNRSADLLCVNYQRDNLKGPLPAGYRMPNRSGYQHIPAATGYSVPSLNGRFRLKPRKSRIRRCAHGSRLAALIKRYTRKASFPFNSPVQRGGG